MAKFVMLNVATFLYGSVACFLATNHQFITFCKQYANRWICFWSYM